jgi:hypothetical protein
MTFPPDLSVDELLLHVNRPLAQLLDEEVRLGRLVGWDVRLVGDSDFETLIQGTAEIQLNLTPKGTFLETTELRFNVSPRPLLHRIKARCEEKLRAAVHKSLSRELIAN